MECGEASPLWLPRGAGRQAQRPVQRGAPSRCGRGSGVGGTPIFCIYLLAMASSSSCASRPINTKNRCGPSGLKMWARINPRPGPRSLPTSCRLALESGGLGLPSRSAGIESGDTSPRSTLLPVLEQAAFPRAPAWEQAGLWSAARRRRFGFPAERGDRPNAPFSAAPPQDVGEDQPEARAPILAHVFQACP